MRGTEKDKQTISIPREFNSLENKKDEKTNRYIPSARVMGQLYGDGGTYYENIVFPLLDVFKEYFKQAENPIFLNYVYLVLSDQSSIFSSEFIKDTECPFWMDTCTLELLIRRYLTEELGLENEQIIPIIIQPEIQEGQQILKGIDHWNEMLTQVDKLLLPEYFEDEEIYVSHQAGTPAISSAVQFVSISRSDQIKFLVSNKQQVLDKDLLNENDGKQWRHEAEVIPASQYWREMQIQKARKLLEKGNPAAVLTIIEDLS